MHFRVKVMLIVEGPTVTVIYINTITVIYFNLRLNVMLV